LKVKHINLEKEFDTKSAILKETEISCSAILENNREMTINIENMTSELSSLNFDLNRLYVFKESQDIKISTLAAEVLDRENNVIYLEKNITTMTKQHQEELDSALEGLAYTMNQKREEDLSLLTAKLSDENDMRVGQKEEQISKLNGKLAQVIQERVEGNRTNEDENERKQKIHEACILGVELERDNCQKLLESANGTISGRDEEINNLMMRIAESNQTLKMLEQDKADIYQKMISSDRNIRQEMTEKYSKETNQLILVHESQIRKAIDEFEQNSKADHRVEIARITEEIKLKHIFELQKLYLENQAKYEGFVAEMDEKNASIITLETIIKTEKVEIQHLHANHSKNIEELADAHLRQIEDVKIASENEYLTREKAIKVQAVFSAANAKMKHAALVAKKEEDFIQKIKVLVYEKNQALQALQKEADILKELEISRIRQGHRDEQELLNTIFEQRMNNQLLKSQNEMDASIAELCTDYDSQIKELKLKVEGFDISSVIHFESERLLKENILNLEETNKRLTYEVDSLTLAFKTQKTDFENKTVELQETYGN
jgi:hypothetical protein